MIQVLCVNLISRSSSLYFFYIYFFFKNIGPPFICAFSENNPNKSYRGLMVACGLTLKVTSKVIWSSTFVFKIGIWFRVLKKQKNLRTGTLWPMNQCNFWTWVTWKSNFLGWYLVRTARHHLRRGTLWLVEIIRGQH